MTTVSDVAVLAALREAVRKAGSLTAFASRASVSPAYVRDVVQENRPPGKKILAALGLRRAVVRDGGAR